MSDEHTTPVAYGIDTTGETLPGGDLQDGHNTSSHHRHNPHSRRRRNTLVFIVLVLVWLAADMLTKHWFSAHTIPNVASPDFLPGLIRFRLVHNTGAAWGIFSNSTFMLGVLSLFVCAFFAAYLFLFSPNAPLFEVFGIALVVAGGIGNALDRFILGYVVDFIEFVFFDFPVFNIADIGVTCGFVIFLAGLLLRGHDTKRAELHNITQADNACEDSVALRDNCEADRQ